MSAGFPTFRGYGLKPLHETRLSELLAERCQEANVTMGSLEASELAAELYAAYLRAFRADQPTVAYVPLSPAPAACCA